MRLQDKVAIVTGSASGIGKAIAHRFAREGAFLIIADKNEGAIPAAVDEIKVAGGGAAGFPLDVADRGQVQPRCVSSVTPDRKSIMASRSFGRPVTTLSELREAVAAYTARAAEKLRRQHLATAHLMVFIETNRFKPDDAQHYATQPVRLPVGTSDTGKLIRAALAGLKGIWRDGYRYKKAGVVLLDLHPAAAVQEGLFDKADAPRRTTLMRTIDRLNTRFGRETITFAATGRRRPWKLRRELLSPCYTTAWDQLLRVYGAKFETQRDLCAPPAAGNRVCQYGWKPIAARRGRSPKSRAASAARNDAA